MNAYADLLRLYWLPGLIDVSPKQAKSDLRSWIADEKFQVYSPANYPAVLSTAAGNTVCQAFACEIVRMSLAARESVASVKRVPELPKTRAWAMVEWYYASFYAAHALLRMCGTALVQLEAGHVSSIRRVSGLYGQPCGVSSGFHSVRFDHRLNQLTLTKMVGDGSHEFLWREFDGFLRIVSTTLLQAPGSDAERQALAVRLDELRSILNAGGSSAGAWLSYVRNRVNYRHEYGAWYPYQGHDGDDLESFFSVDPLPPSESLSLPAVPLADPVRSFFSACRFIVALCRDCAYEMNRRSRSPVHFHAHGLLQLDLLLAGR